MFIIKHKYIIILGCVGKKTALLQAEASACVSGLANVQFCGSAVHYIVFLLLSFCSKFFTVALSFYACAQRMALSGTPDRVALRACYGHLLVFSLSSCFAHGF